MSAVLDSSAVLALLNGEAGAEKVALRLEGAAISAVNVAEVGTKLIDGGMTTSAAQQAIDLLRMRIVNFDEDLAISAYGMRSAPKAVGLSLGDRACLALALKEGGPAITADRNWATLKLPCEVKLIR